MTDHINEFFKITGRPISTMTVDEYIKLISIDRPSGERVYETPLDTSDIVKDTVTPVISVENKSVSPFEETKVSKTVDTKDKREMALSLLKGVKG